MINKIQEVEDSLESYIKMIQKNSEKVMKDIR